ncbi:interferon-induced 35 kDa protein [Pyxicephalus adspersus]|uniref:interferon-induced 35 kDa protein n=1 Tax=Pyxicephalus adspersus TaxID=30357 RepID=UPI003B59E25D
MWAQNSTHPETMEIQKLLNEIQTWKDKYSALADEVSTMEKDTLSIQSLVDQLQNSVDNQKSKIGEYEEKINRNEQEHKENIRIMLEENGKLELQIQHIKETSEHLEKETENLKKICSPGLIKKMVFKGNVGNNMSSLSVKHQIKYPVNGGSALITFQKPSVAQQIIAAQQHKVNVDECWINVKAEAVELSVLNSITVSKIIFNQPFLQMKKLECNRTVLITGIPDITENDNLRDLLEIHFQKPSNGGGDVQDLVYCPEGQHTVALFEDEDDGPLRE